MFSPSKTIEFTTPLKKEEVINKLNSNLDQTEDFGIIGVRRQSFRNYEDFIKDDSIQFRRILKNGANSFIPLFKGSIETKGNKTSIKLHADLHIFVKVLLTIMKCFASLFLLLSAISGAFHADLSFITIPIIILTATFIVPWLAFNYELYKLENDLNKFMVHPTDETYTHKWINTSTIELFKKLDSFLAK